MSVVLVHEGPSFTRERYDEIVRRLAGRSRMESVADWPVEGLLVHIASEGERGFRVVDVWESEDACRRFAEKLKPILEEVGVDEPARLYPPHAFVSA
ncbi:hypothetical protein ACFQY4_37490 [Catellatospora bangladeshensis]|uniref:ABM domain-containing protein n=1 Tax=Catellatospora bangladeshensis TaxID=310355 RepID=A0A8J3NJR2_9ACTN|nr:hypothetical protein [Catellatospora bangladeshensis]GIF83322.1 hypothetical protein Cba03nite_46710 [Catellatospora bangladeshensis]